MDQSIEIRHLRYFLSVAETQNFTRAAERVGISQPSISQQIKDLEDRLGTPLFARLGKRVRLNEAGRLFQLHAERVLLKLDEACESVGQIVALASGRIEVGVIPALQLAWVPPVLEQLTREHPGIVVALHELPSREIETEVEAGRLDLGLGIVADRSPNLTLEPLLSQHLQLIVPRGSAFDTGRSLEVKDLDAVPLVLMPVAFDMRQLVEAVFRYAGLRPRVAFEIETVDSTLQAVLRTQRPAILPPIVLQGREHLDLCAVPLVSDAPPLVFGQLWPRGTDPTPAARLFGELVAARARATAAELPGRTAPA
jgi:LysR family cyn operon transcriptional activator